MVALAARKDNPLAPAKLYKWSSSLARVRAVVMVGVAPLNTQSFRTFQMVQAPRIMREFRPFLVSPLTIKADLSHQSSNEGSSGCGASVARPKNCSNSNKKCLAKTQPTSRCWMFSSSWSHSGQRSGWGRPLRASRSAVQQRLWAAILNTLN